MSSESGVVSQTSVPETNVDEMKTNAKKVMEQAVAASQKRSLDNASEDSSNSLVGLSADDDSNLAKNGSRTKKLRVANEENGDESLDQVEDVEDEENDEEDIDEEDDYAEDVEENGEAEENGEEVEDDENGEESLDNVDDENNEE